MEQLQIKGMAKGHGVSVNIYDDNINLLIWRPMQKTVDEIFSCELVSRHSRISSNDHEMIKELIIGNLMSYVDWLREVKPIRKIPSEQELVVTADKLMNIIKTSQTIKQ